jgi:type II secretory ATPase GspE/PulE/Tfp pilus assembly ATPase PilB-like protein
VTRLLDMGVESFLVSSALFGVLSQRLVRKICPVCHGKTTDAKGNKCRKCNGSGYKGRCGIFELLAVSDDLRTAINRNASSSELEAIAVREGMVTLQDDGLAKVKAGVTTLEELNRPRRSCRSFKRWDSTNIWRRRRTRRLTRC